MAWRKIWTNQTPLDKLYAVLGTKMVTRETFVSAIRNYRRLPAGDSCPICQGYHWIQDETYGPMWCFCYLIDWQKHWVKTLAPLRSATRTWTDFDHYRIDPRKPHGKSLTEALVAASDFADNPTNKWLILSGGTGTGKSHLLEAIAKQLGKVSLYLAAQDLGKLVYGATADHTLEAVLDAIEHVPVLLLDDYGAEHSTDYLDAAIGRVINTRYQAYQEYATAVATNIPIDFLRQRDARVGSRLVDVNQSVRIQISAPDFRLQL